MSDNLRPDSDVIERVTEMLCELAELGYYRGKEIAEALAAAGLLTPSGTFASTKPSDADVAEQIAGAIVRGADPAYMLSKPGSDDYSDGYRLGIRDAADIARSHATPPVASPEIPGFEGTRSALDGLTIRKEKTSD